MKILRFAVICFFLAPLANAEIIRVELDGLIHPMADEFVARALAEAKSRNADAVLIELRTPGGLENSMRAIVESIIRSPVPVIVWVGPSGARAASAGFFILQAADIAAMAPGTNTGAAHPVTLGEQVDDTMKTKMQEDAAAFMRTLAQRRGRNVAAAESGVREAKSFTEDEALRLRLIDVIAADVPSLIRWADGKTIRRFNGTTTEMQLAGKPITDYDKSLKQRLLGWIMDPNVAFILMSLGMLALWAEFNNPGAILPGVVGLIAILLSVFALNLLPVRYAAIALIIVAFILFALEAQFTSYGILGIGGAVCLVFGALLLVDGPIPEMRVHLVTAIVVAAPVAAVAVFLMTLVVRARHHRVTTGTEGMIGEIGIARTMLEPEGQVFVHGELWNATATTSLPAGSRVRVQSVDGLRVLVEPAE